MPKVIVNGQVVADSDRTVVVEGNHYFPREAVRAEYLEESTLTTVCGWKGTASYYHVVVDGDRRTDAAWYYPQPSRRARAIADHIAFYRHKVDAIID